MRAGAAVLEADSGRQESLIRRAQQGDISCFEALYRDHVGRVHALCRRISGDAGRAEDLTQEVFARAWRHLPAFRGDSLFSTWLHRLAVNVILGDQRSRVRRPDQDPSGDDPDTIPSAPREPDRAADLQRAIAALPAGAREVFVLHDVEGYLHEEIARMTGRSAGTCKAQLHRARMLLREALG